MTDNKHMTETELNKLASTIVGKMMQLKTVRTGLEKQKCHQK